MSSPSSQFQRRLSLSVAGAFAGLGFWLLSVGLVQGLVSGRLAFGLAAFLLWFFTAFLGLTGPLGPGRAARLALVPAGVFAGLLSWAGWRFDTPEALFSAPAPAFAAFVLITLPLPFVIAAARGNWRDYPTLFTEAWGLVLRFAAAWLFTGVVWLVAALSAQLLSLVGIGQLRDVLAEPAVIWLLSGAILGLGLAVVDELGDIISPWLLLRLLRLLVPVVLLVTLVFLLALPFQGTGRLLGSFSAAGMMLILVALGATLVTSAVERHEDGASDAPLIAGAARVMALVLVLPALIAGYAIWLRVAQFGWTPNRIFAACLVAVGVGYGLLYLVAALGRQWRAGVRNANIIVALALIAVSVLLLTPLLNPEALAARDQVRRAMAGQGKSEDLLQLNAWGRAGAEALAGLRDHATRTGQEPLLRALDEAARNAEIPQEAGALRAELARVMPLSPAGAGAARDALLATRFRYEMEQWLSACRRAMTSGRPACVMVFADLWPDHPGDEALVLTLAADGQLQGQGFLSPQAAQAGMGAGTEERPVTPLSGAWPRGAAAEALLTQLQQAGPDLVALPGQAISVPGGLLLFQY